MNGTIGVSSLVQQLRQCLIMQAYGNAMRNAEITLDQPNQAAARILARQLYTLLIHLCEGLALAWHSFEERLFTMVWKRGDCYMNGISQKRG